MPHRINIHQGIALDVDGKDVTANIHQKGKVSERQHNIAAFF
jgi:hypothetical protein